MFYVERVLCNDVQCSNGILALKLSKLIHFEHHRLLQLIFFCPCQDLLINAAAWIVATLVLTRAPECQWWLCFSLKNAGSASIWNHHYITFVNVSHVEIGDYQTEQTSKSYTVYCIYIYILGEFHVRSSSCSRIRANPIWRLQKTHLYDWVHQWTQDTVWNCQGLQSSGKGF